MLPGNQPAALCHAMVVSMFHCSTHAPASSSHELQADLELTTSNISLKTSNATYSKSVTAPPLIRPLIAPRPPPHCPSSAPSPLLAHPLTAPSPPLTHTGFASWAAMLPPSQVSLLLTDFDWA